MLVGGLLAVLLGLWPYGARAATYTFVPEADAYVAQEAPDANYGTGASNWFLRLGTYQAKFNRTFLRFDLSAIPAGELITQARLTLVIQSGPNADFTIDARHVPTDAWLEGGITWNNQPDSGNTLDNQAVWGDLIRGGYGKLVTWNLLAQPVAWNWQADLSDNLLSLVLLLPTENSTIENYIHFRSKEGLTLVPTLSITTAPVPLPPGLLLFGSGLLGLACLRRFRRG